MNEAPNNNQAPRDLSRSLQKQYDFLIHNSRDIIAVCSTGFQIGFISPSVTEILGYSADSLTGTSLTGMIHPDEQNLISSQVSSFLEQGLSEITAEFRLRHSDGEYRWFELKIGSFKEADAIRRIMIILRDVTERHVLQDRLAEERNEALQQSQARQDFLAFMSHEIRNPLNVIVGMADLLTREVFGQPQKQRVEMISRAGDHLLGLINDILDLSRLESGRMLISPHITSVHRLLKEELLFLKSDAERKKLKYNIHIEPDVPEPVVLDSRGVRQILTNLTGNAIRFTSEGSITIHVKFRNKTGPVLRFCVEDTGPGIPPELKSELFKPFKLSSESAGMNGEVHGMGLAIARRLVELMGGDMWLNSSPGSGAKFFFEVPVSVPDTGSDQTSEVSVHEAEVKPARILLAEDSVDNIALIQAYFADSIHRLDVVENGKVAVQQHIRKAYDLILMDLRMPVMDGFRATKLIRRLEKRGRAPKTSVVAFTAAASESDKKDSKEAGCDSFIVKPVKRAELFRKINQLLGERSHSS